MPNNKQLRQRFRQRMQRLRYNRRPNRRRPRRRWYRRRRYRYRPRRDQQYQYFRNTKAVAPSENRSRFTSTPIENNGLRVTGYDLVYDMNSISVDPTSGTFVTIPANPAYWKGTRVAQIAVAYSQYRPIYMRFDYFPQVSMSDSGTVTSGTIWNDAPSSSSVSQALTTSNGGKTHTVWSKSRTRVKIGSNLDQNLYDLSGPLDQDSNPFIFLAINNDPKSGQPVPGYYMCQYTFEFKNPIGDGNEYDIDEKSAGDITETDVWECTSAVLKSESAGFAPGTVLTITVIEGVVQFLLKGSRLGVAANLVFSLFKNRNKNVRALSEEYEDRAFEFVSGVPTSMVTNLFYIIKNPGGAPFTMQNFRKFKDHPRYLDVYPYGWLFDIENPDADETRITAKMVTQMSPDVQSEYGEYYYITDNLLDSIVFVGNNDVNNYYSRPPYPSSIRFGTRNNVLLENNKWYNIYLGGDQESEGLVGSGNIIMV